MSSTTAMLRAAGRQPPLPLQLMLTEGKALDVQQWLRILPGKRLVGRGEWEGQQVLVKLFVATGAERHWQRESVGIQALQRAGITTPDLLDSGELAGGGRYLLTAFLEEARSLQQCWDELTDQSPSSEAAIHILQSALTTIGTLHARGLAQTDLHLGNFLQDGQGLLYVIDGDAIETDKPGLPLAASIAQTNLALFFAQLTPDWDAHQARLLTCYLQAVGSMPVDQQRLLADVQHQRKQRLDDFLRKTLRDCSQFAVHRSFDYFSVVLRSEQHWLAPLLSDPNSVFSDQPLLKDGGSSTVTRATLDGREVVIKRYNIKGLGHWLKRFWRPSRAWHSWLAGWRLSFLGIATPKPLAMIERRIGPWRREAWLVTEYCPGQNLLDHLGEAGRDLPDQQTANALQHIFKQLADAQITHGDFKATNLLWHEQQVWLIDLDAMQAHEDDASWRKGWAKDRARFVRNWEVGSGLANNLEHVIPH